MRKLSLIVFILFCCVLNSVYGQECLGGGCSNLNVNYPVTIIPATTSWGIVNSTQGAFINGGNYAYYNVTAGNTYEWTTCSTYGGYTGFDAQLTLYNGVCFSDNACGTAPYLRWTAPTNQQVIVLVSAPGCQSNGPSGPFCTLVWRICNAVLLTQTSSDVTITEPSSANFNVGVTGTLPTFQWEYSTNGGTNWNSVPNVSPYSGVNSSNLSISSTTASMSGNKYRCKIGGNCTTTFASNWATLNVNSNCTVPSTPSNPSKNSPPCGTVTLTRSGNVPSNEIWYWQGSSCGTSTSLGSGSTYSANSSGIYYIRSYNTSGGCWSNSCGSINVTVNPGPSVTPTSNEPVTAPNAINLFANTISGATYLWTGPNSFSSAQQNPVINPSYASMSGDYCVTATVSGCGTQSCTTVNVSGASQPNVNSLIGTNVILDHPGVDQNYTFYSNNAPFNNLPIKICADGSKASYFKVNVSNTSGINFRILDENQNILVDGQSSTDVEKYGRFDIPYTIGSDEVEVAYTHPEFMDFNGIYRPCFLQILYNGIPINGASFTLNIYRAPVLFVHGLWGGETSFNDMFYDFINTSFHVERLLYRVNYEGDNHGASLGFAENSSVIYKNINAFFQQMRDDHYSGGKVDIVAHSMGGLLTRFYISDKNPVHYRFDIHKFITIDVPNSGTQSANLLLSPWADGVRPILDFIGNKTRLGAVRDLCASSPAISNLNASQSNSHNIPVYAFKNFIQFSDASIGDGNHDKLIIDLSYYQNECNYSSQFGFTKPQDLLDYIYYGESSDLIVPVNSQQGGIVRFNNNNFENVHTQTKNDPNLIEAIKIKLNENPNDNSSFDKSGFSPVFLHNRQELNTPPSNSFCKITNEDISINSPQNLDTINNNSNLNLSISSSAGVNRIYCEISNYDSKILTIDTTTNSLNLSLPIPSSAGGKYVILAVGYDSLKLLNIDTLSIFITPIANLDSIHVSPNILYIPENETFPLKIEGFYSDGIVRDISSFPGISYSIIDTNIVTHNSVHSIFGKSQGQTIIAVCYMSQCKTITANVYQGVNYGMAAFSILSNNVCKGGSITFSNISTSNPSGVQWEFSGGTPSQSTLQNPVVTYNNNGTYDVRLIATYVGKIDTLFLSNYITVDSIPSTPSITITNINDTIAFVSSPSASYEWLRNDTIISDANSQTYAANDSSHYKVRLKSLNGCISDTSLSVVKPTLYTFIGDGYWDIPSNWVNNILPISHLPFGEEIIIDPVVNGECILNRLQTIGSGAKFTVRQDKKFTVQGDLTVSGGLPVITTIPIDSITSVSAIAGGNVLLDGGTSITTRGICYSTSVNPSIADNIIASGTGAGLFTVSLSGLLANTVYYIRAYAKNSLGTSYGNEVNFFNESGTFAYRTILCWRNYFLLRQYWPTGLVCAPTDQGYLNGSSTNYFVHWGCEGTNITGTLTALGTGAQIRQQSLQDARIIILPQKFAMISY